MNDRCALMRKIQAADFAIQEAVLFLDTHPNHRKALDYYRQHKKMRERLVAAYEEKYGPLTVTGNEDENYWRWIENPWPWEGEY